MARKIDTNLLEFLNAMKLNPSKRSVMMFDVETNNPRASSLKELRIFDFGYGDFNPFTGTKGTVKSNIIYEGIINPLVVQQISEWNKIKNAGANEYYGLFNLLKAQDWWSKRAILKEGIADRVTKPVVQKELTTRLYELQSVILPEHHRVLDVWQGKWSERKNAEKFAAQRMEGIMKTNQTIRLFSTWLESESHLEAMIKGNNYTKNTTYDTVMGSIYSEVYKEQYENIKESEVRRDADFFRKVEQKVGVNFTKNLERWGKVITDFDNDLANNKDLLGITAYNISHDARSIDAMNSTFGVSPETGRVTGDRYRSICMMNMIGLLRNKKAEEIIQGMSTFDDKFYERAMIKALEKETLRTESFEFLYENVFGTTDYAQTHSAKGDVNDQIDVATKVIQDFLQKEFKEGWWG